MTVRDPHIIVARGPALRQMTCVQCGAPFECALDGNCWCAHESVRLPMPADGDCLCPGCLRETARRQQNAKP